MIPTLITIEYDTATRIYSLVSNPDVIIAVTLIVGIIVLVILKYIEKRDRRRQMIIDNEIIMARRHEPETPREEILPTSPNRLQEKEEELRRVEEKLKARKRKDLEERELELRKKEDEYSKNPETREETARGTATTHYDIERTTSRLKQLQDERRRIKKMIELVEERYDRGELNKDSFTKMITEYQRQLVDLDIKIRDAEET